MNYNLSLTLSRTTETKVPHSKLSFIKSSQGSRKKIIPSPFIYIGWPNYSNIYVYRRGENRLKTRIHLKKKQFIALQCISIENSTRAEKM